MNDNAAILPTNTSPTKMARIPTIILSAENPDRINAIPKIIKLNPMKMDKNAVLKIGQIIKINPKIIDNIPDILFDSMFFLLQFVVFTFSSEKFKNLKSNKLSF